MSVFLPPYLIDLATGEKTIVEGPRAAYGVTPDGKTFAYEGADYSSSFTLSGGGTPESYLLVIGKIVEGLSSWVLKKSGANTGLRIYLNKWRLVAADGTMCETTVNAAAGDVMFARGKSAGYELITHSERLTGSSGYGNWNALETIGGAAGNGDLALIIRWVGDENTPTTEEAQQLIENPWQIFQPQTYQLPTLAAVEHELALIESRVPWIDKPHASARPSSEFAKDLWQFIVPAADGWANIAPQTKGDWDLGVGTLAPGVDSSLGRSWGLLTNTNDVACQIHTGAGGKVRPNKPITLMARVNIQGNKYGQIHLTFSDTGWNADGYHTHYRWVINPTNHYAPKMYFGWTDSAKAAHFFITPAAETRIDTDTIVAVVYDFSTLRFFVDGVEVHTVAISSDFTEDPIDHSSGLIRAFYSDSTNGPRCTSDFLTIHNRAMSNEEIAHYSEDFNGRAFEPRTDLIPQTVNEGPKNLIEAKHPWVEQPQIPTPIVGSLATGFVDGVCGSMPYGITGRMFTQNLHTVSPVIHGNEKWFNNPESPEITVASEEYFSSPFTMVARVRLNAVPGSGTYSIFGSFAAGDYIGFRASPYQIFGYAQKNYGGVSDLGVASSGAAKPQAGSTYLLVLRSFSDTDHRLEVWRDDGGYQVANSTADMSAISLTDWGTNAFVLGNNNAVRDFEVSFGGFWDRSLTDSELDQLRKNPWHGFRPRTEYVQADAQVSVIVGGSSITATAVLSSALSVLSAAGYVNVQGTASFASSTSIADVLATLVPAGDVDVTSIASLLAASVDVAGAPIDAAVDLTSGVSLLEAIAALVPAGDVDVTSIASLLAATGSAPSSVTTGTVDVTSGVSALALAAYVNVLGTCELTSSISDAALSATLRLLATVSLDSPASEVGAAAVLTLLGQVGVSSSLSALVAAGSYTSPGVDADVAVSSALSQLAAVGVRGVPTVLGAVDVESAASLCESYGAVQVYGTVDLTSGASQVYGSGAYVPAGFVAMLIRHSIAYIQFDNNTAVVIGENNSVAVVQFPTSVVDVRNA